MKARIRRTFQKDLRRDLGVEDPTGLDTVSLESVQPVYNLLTPDIRRETFFHHTDSVSFINVFRVIVQRGSQITDFNRNHVIPAEDIEYIRFYGVDAHITPDAGNLVDVEYFLFLEKEYNSGGIDRNMLLFFDQILLSPGQSGRISYLRDRDLFVPTRLNPSDGALNFDPALDSIRVRVTSDPTQEAVVMIIAVDYEIKVRKNSELAERLNLQ